MPGIGMLTGRYGDPGFHRHVDAAKILGLLCMSCTIGEAQLTISS